MKKKLISWCSNIFQGFCIGTIVILVVCPLSCHISTEGVDFISGDYISPKLENYTVLDGKHIALNFSEDVNLTSICVNPQDKNVLQESIAIVKKGHKDGEIIIELKEDTKIGVEYFMGGIVEDNFGNSLTFSLPFRGFNNRIPAIIIREVQPKYSKVSDGRYRSEFVKLQVLEDGNLFGLKIGSATNGPELDYYFPSLEVSKNDIVVVHFRNKGEGCIQELDNNIDISTAPNSCHNGRDLWLNNKDTVLSDHYDVIYLKNINNNKIIDGFMYSDKSKTEWPTGAIELAEELVKAGIYDSSKIEDATNIEGNKPTEPFVCTNIDELIKLYNSGDLKLPILNSKKNWKPVKNDEKITVK